MSDGMKQGDAPRRAAGPPARHVARRQELGPGRARRPFRHGDMLFSGRQITGAPCRHKAKRARCFFGRVRFAQNRARGGGQVSAPYHSSVARRIAFPVSSAGGDAKAMWAHRRAFPTPRGSGESDPSGGARRPPDIVARHLRCRSIAARLAPCRKPPSTVLRTTEL